MKVQNHSINNIYFLNIPSESRIWPATINYNTGKTVYNEKLFTIDGIEYRTWDAYKSKLASCISEKMKGIPENLETMRILYLGAATGTTVSHLSDVVADHGGIIFSLEFSMKSARRLIQLSQSRKNIIPIIGDARRPNEYASQVWYADFIFQDVSQINQAQIFIDNVELFLKPGGKGIFIVKAASIDSTRPLNEVVQEQVYKIEEKGLIVEQILDISNFEKEHKALLVRKN